MMRVLEILDAVAATSKRTEKEAILEKHKANAELKRAIWLAEDKLINYYVRKVLPYKAKGKAPLSTVFGVLENVLATRSLTGDKALEYLKKMMEELHPDDALVIERILNRDLRCGAGIPTFNKIWGNKFLIEYPVMLCAGWDHVDRIEFPAFLQLKADGMRINAIIRKGGSVEYRSRAGSEVHINNPRFDDYFADIDANVVLDGELLVMDKNGKVLDRKTSNGICNKAIKGTISKEESDMLYFQFWDCIDLDVFQGKARSTEAYETRLARLETICKGSGICEVIETRTVSNLKEAQKLFQAYLKKGMEGAVLKNTNALWEDTRSKDQIKMKAILEADLKVTGWEEGKGKYKGKIGAIIVQDASGTVEVNVGSGFTDKERNMNPKEFLGKIVAVEYNAVISSKGKDKRSLYLPRFLIVRHDKSKADTL